MTTLSCLFLRASSFTTCKALYPFQFINRLNNGGLFSSSRDESSKSTLPAHADGECIERSYPNFQLLQFPCLNCNYGYIIHDMKTGETAAIDTPDASRYVAELEKREWKLTHIFNTHHHLDHAGCNLQLKEESYHRYSQKFPMEQSVAGAGVVGDIAKIFGPKIDGHSIPGLDVPLAFPDTDTYTDTDNDRHDSSSTFLEFGNMQVHVMDVGGHTKGHVAFYFPMDKVVFVGDALFALGCGKMFEGTSTQYWESLKRLRNLPDDTVVYCAHEITERNAEFALSVEPGNLDLIVRVHDIKMRRKRGEPTVPSLMGEEKDTNPFLRGDVSEEIRRNVGAFDEDSFDVVFGKIRAAKDNFQV
eukprot:CAMPEP_0176489268 /NCGR_PEP_ID=MMETSP0200_2-20121128/7188_1 /TAXON_ID=947934 /ORGANISM="Chaetoceros sp., Strain GSL56" /LENGTH=358 /DNA_ID=CAMNT_0017886379 /DNA_START=227 /DNA_END=1303 /DNA_ORIENTATION=-